jgi:hypothetical protein
MELRPLDSSSAEVKVLSMLVSIAHSLLCCLVASVSWVLLTPVL